MNEIREMIGSRIFSDLDRHFSRFIEAQANGNFPLLAFAAALTSRSRTEGHICLDLEALAETSFPEKPVEGMNPIRLPGLATWVKELKSSPLVGSPAEFRPLVMDAHHRLYLHRYWKYEQTLAAELLKRSSYAADESNDKGLAQNLKAFFPADSTAGSVNLQSVAAFAAARGKFCVISGGPGTGKTHTLVLILAVLLELDPARKLRIAVTAPTGKAATRIQESIRKIKDSMTCSEEIKSRLPENAITIHRLLGYIPDSAYFRHNTENLLPFDVVAVDEASMVDLALMAKLFQAIPPSARVIILGDKDQLASVEAGAVLGDICSAVSLGSYSSQFNGHFEKLTGHHLPNNARVNQTPALDDCVVQLKRNFRFGEKSTIFQLSTAINDGSAEDVFAILRSAGGDAMSDLFSTTLPIRAKLKNALKESVITGFGDFLKTPDPLQAITAMSRFRVLCALREGPFGVNGLNKMIEEILEEAGLINGQIPWYSHRPIMITRMRHGIVTHDVEVNADTIHLLRDMKFVFICIDYPPAKKLIIERLEEWGIPFIDVGMGVYRADDSLGGTIRSTASIPEDRATARKKVSFTDSSLDDEYALNIQIGDLNALNAILAVIKWKKMFGFYLDCGAEMHCSYMIEMNQLSNLDTRHETTDTDAQVRRIHS